MDFGNALANGSVCFSAQEREVITFRFVIKKSKPKLSRTLRRMGTDIYLLLVTGVKRYPAGLVKKSFVHSQLHSVWQVGGGRATHRTHPLCTKM